MPETITAAEFEQRVARVSERLDALRGQPRASATVGSTLPYAGLDLSAELPEMAPILSALIHQDPEDPVAKNARIEVGGRRVALATIMTLLQGGEGLADFNARYAQLMGAEPEYDLFERVLPPAMREAGLPLPAKSDSKRLLESLLAHAGLPSALLVATAEYFTIYWRLFHPQPDPLAALQGAQQAAAGGKGWAGLDATTLERLASLAKRLLPNGAVVTPTMEGLIALMEYLRTQPRWRVGDLLSHSDEIHGASGVDPAKLLQGNADVITLLDGALGLAWHPEQFRHALMSFPRGSEVRLPNGSLAMVDKAIAVPYWGLYQLERKTYLVLPNEGMSIADLVAAPEASLSVQGNRVLWRGSSEATVLADGWPQVGTPRALFDDRQPLGFFYVQTPPKARTLKVGDQTLAPQAGVHWRTELFVDVVDGQPRFHVRVLGLRVCLPHLAKATLQVESPQAETAGRLTFELDERGVGGLPDRVLTLTQPTSGHFEVYLQDHGSGEVVEFEGRRVTSRVPMPEVMLFAEGTGVPVSPAPTVAPFGLPSYLLAATRPVNTSAMQMQEIGIEPLAKAGDYEVHRLTWREAAGELSIHVDARFQWHFAQRVDATWQAAALPAPEAPLAFAPETPIGYTVSTADNLMVDDLSLVLNPLVAICLDGETLAAHTWSELNWMMNFPVENRRFSGVMLRRALHVTPEFDLAGKYTLQLTAAGDMLSAREVTVLPALSFAVTPQGAVDEDVEFRVVARCEGPTFANGAREVAISLGSPVVDRESMENSPFRPKPLEAVLPLEVPLVELKLAVEPDVRGYRLLDENEGTWIRKTNLSFEELAHITLVLFAPNGQQGTLTVGDGEALTEEFYEGFATFSLASLQDTLTAHETEVKVATDGRPVGTLTVVWHAKVAHFEAVNEYLQENTAHLELSVRGPKDTPLRLEANAPDGRRLGTMEIEPDGDQMRQIAFSLPASRDYPVITIKVFVPTEQSGVASGSLEVRNASFEPEIEALNQRISADPQRAELRNERAQLLLARGLRKAAARDFQAAIDLGMTGLVDSPQYQQFLSQRRAESFHEDIKALASFFVPFARKELTIG